MRWRRPTCPARKVATAVALAGAAALTASSCGMGPQRTLDSGRVAAQIGTELSSRYQLPVGLVSVRCPTGIPAVTGQVFICESTLAGQALRVDGRVTSGGGRYTVVPAEAVIVVAHAVAMLQSGITAQLHQAVRVSCGAGPVLVRAAGASFSCTATVGGRLRRVAVVVVDVQGNVRYTLAPPASVSGATTAPPKLQSG